MPGVPSPSADKERLLFELVLCPLILFHHIKFESFHDFSWKFRYLANSISTKNTTFSFLFKIKLDRDPFFYGIGNSTSKSTRASATYSSVFFGSEIKQNISDGIVVRWSPGLEYIRVNRKSGAPLTHCDRRSS